jgi:cell shape-determining protein MreC
MKMNLQRIDILENEIHRLRSIKSEMAKKIENIKIAKIIQRDVIPNKESIQMSIGSKDYIKIGTNCYGNKWSCRASSRSKYVFK